ncbi:MAG TPA: YtxH domain-containing protein [Anaerolineales bacterium]|jgi:gas vesicle protein
MRNENQEPEYRGNNVAGVLAGLLLGGLVGATAMLLLAPQSGKETRTQIQEKGVELRDRTTGMMDEAMTKVRSNADKLTVGGREKFNELKQHGQVMAVEQLNRVSDAAQAGKKAIQSS